ncbi:hypothetical protein [Aliterella atlantica]|nr:hypothetical protein [Aliterella atlantica]
MTAQISDRPNLASWQLCRVILGLAVRNAIAHCLRELSSFRFTQILHQ